MQIRTVYKPEVVARRRRAKEEPSNLSDPYLDAEAELLLATDGHRLVAVPVETAAGERSGYIAGELLKVARKKAKKAGVAKIVDLQELAPFDIEWPASPDHVGHKFPDWRGALPKFREGDPGTHTIGINADLLKGLADALGGGGLVALTFRLEGAEAARPEPFLVRAFGGEAEEIGVLMPCRLDRETGKPAPQAAVVELPAEEKKAAEHERIEQEADEVLRKGGSPELAAARPRASKSVRDAVQRLKDSVPEGTEVTFTAPGGRSTTIKGTRR